MTPLRICFLWHQHQPDYRSGDSFFLPWVRMHAAKDYSSLPLIMKDYAVKHTVNVVPSMLFQLDEYKIGRLDPLDLLMALDPATFSAENRTELWQWASTIQRPTMTEHLPRLSALLESGSASALSTEQILDLQALILIAWIGPVHRQNDARVQSLSVSSAPYSKTDIEFLRSVHGSLMNGLVPLLYEMESNGQIEVSLTPFHHPILPLLCNSDSATEAIPEIQTPSPPFKARDDAKWHVEEAIRYWGDLTGKITKGMWPAEGSISNEALSVMAAAGVKWVASDEGVLKNSLKEWYRTAPYHPYSVSTAAGPIVVLFRDHALSDAIGFEYSTWDPEVAADNFMARLYERREKIIQDEGEGALESAVIPIMLDGENCWEFYPNNGEPFLRALFSRLQDSPLFESATCGEIATQLRPKPLASIVAGSWINSSFDVWIGSPTKNLAWSLVRHAREAIRRDSSMEYLLPVVYTLEASDWYWWYDDRHIAPHKPEFDRQFRKHLTLLYESLGLEPDADLTLPLYHTSKPARVGTDHRQISYGNNTMHDANAIIKMVTLDTDSNWQRLTFEQQRAISEKEEVIATIVDRLGNERRLAIMSGETLFQSALHDEGFDRDENNNARVFLHATTEWTVTLEEQREGGGTHTTTIELSI